MAAYGISGCAGHTAIYLSHAHQASEKKNVLYPALLGSRGCSRSEKNSWPNDPANNKCGSPTLYLAGQKTPIGERRGQIWLTVGDPLG
jgi:hypothetical protein